MEMTFCIIGHLEDKRERYACVHWYSLLKPICAFITIIWEYHVYVNDQIGKFGCSPVLENVLNYWPEIKHI